MNKTASPRSYVGPQFSLLELQIGNKVPFKITTHGTVDPQEFKLTADKSEDDQKMKTVLEGRIHLQFFFVRFWLFGDRGFRMVWRERV